MAEKVTFASVISSRGFRFLWFNQILVQLAYNTLNFALIIWVFKLVNSNLAVAGLLLATYLPAIFFGIFAGVFVDIVDRRKLIILIDLLMALAFFIFIWIKSSYILILLNTFFINSLAQFFMPSESSSIPMLVSKRQLFLANSLFSLTLYGSFMVGFSIGGPILNHFGINSLFIMGAVILLFAFVLAQNLPTIKVLSAKGKSIPRLSFSKIGRIFDLTVPEVKKTLKFIRGKVSLVAAIGLLSLVQGVIGVLAVITPSYLETVLRIHATDASYFVMLPLGFGMVTGALVVGRFFHNLPRRFLVVPAIITSGLLFIIMGLLPLLAQLLQSAELPVHLNRPRYFFRAPSISSFFAVLAFLVGFCTVSIIIPSQTVLQENTVEKNRGKIFAVLFVLMTAFSALTVPLAGALADLFGVTVVMVGLGIVTLSLGVFGRCPSWFFKTQHLPRRVVEFLGTGHWER